jgi:hypothetical protein
MIFSTRKHTILASSLLVLSAMSTQSAYAISSYRSTATYSFIITAINTNSNSDSLANLTIGGSIDDGAEIYTSTLDFSPIYTSASSSHLSTLEDFSNFGAGYTQVFHAEDSIASGSASSEYLGEYIQTFANTSSDVADIFDITIDYSYTLTSTATGQDADSDINIAFSDYSYALDFSGLAHASTAESINGTATDSDSFSFSLNPDEFNVLFVDTTITGNLEAVATVPVPASFWLFGSALLAMPSLRKNAV